MSVKRLQCPENPLIINVIIDEDKEPKGNVEYTHPYVELLSLTVSSRGEIDFDDLKEKTVLAPEDVIYMNSGGATRKMTVENFLKAQ